MIDIAAMILCIGGFGLLSLGLVKLGFLVSLLGSLLWLIYAIRGKAWALVAQSVAFSIFAGIGLFK